MAKIKGLNEIKKALRELGTKGQEMANGVVRQTAIDIRTEAVKNAPANYGKLRQSIVDVYEDGGSKGRIEVGAPYGAYVEFGTRTYVKVPSELASMAMQFKGKGGRGGGSGDFEDSDIFKAILDWVRRKGISYGSTFSVKTRKRTGNKSQNEINDKQAAYMIAISILRKGIRPQPYLWPAYIKYRDEFVKRLEAGLIKVVKDVST